MEAMDLKANPEEDMESEVEHWEIPMVEATVKSSGKMKKRQRGHHRASGRHREPKELTQGDCGSQKKLAATCRKVSRHAAMAQHKGNIFRKIQIQGNCGPRKELAAPSRRMTHSTKVAQHRGCNRKRCNQDSVVQETQKGWTFRKRCWKGPECNNGIRPRPKTAAMRQQANIERRHKMAAAT
jgi:hypothetical protein